MSEKKIKVACHVTMSSMDDTIGYQLQTVAINDFQHLFEFLNKNEMRSKIQKVSLINEGDPDHSITLVVDSLVKK